MSPQIKVNKRHGYQSGCCPEPENHTQKMTGTLITHEKAWTQSITLQEKAKIQAIAWKFCSHVCTHMWVNTQCLISWMCVFHLISAVATGRWQQSGEYKMFILHIECFTLSWPDHFSLELPWHGWNYRYRFSHSWTEHSGFQEEHWFTCMHCTISCNVISELIALPLLRENAVMYYKDVQVCLCLTSTYMQLHDRSCNITLY